MPPRSDADKPYEPVRSKIWGNLGSEETPLTRKGWESDQQLGLARHRERAGRTGKAGRSRAGKRLADFFIGSLLLSQSDHHERGHVSSELETTNLITWGE